MVKQKWTGDLVYSTNLQPIIEKEEDEQITLPNENQLLKIKLDSKHRAGKIVTLIHGFIGKQNDLENLAKQLKTKCGTGGSVKEREIIIQGNYKEKLIELLKQMKYQLKF